MSNKIAVFIDGANCHATQIALRVDIDYFKITKYFGADLLRAYYYTGLLRERGPDNPLIPLIDALTYNGFKMVTKPVKEFVDGVGNKKSKADMDMELAMDAMELAYSGNVTDIWIFSGDGDFVPLVLAVQRRGIRVTIVSTIKTDPPMCADELRRAADVFVDLIDFKAIFMSSEQKAIQQAKRDDRRRGTAQFA